MQCHCWCRTWWQSTNGGYCNWPWIRRYDHGLSKFRYGSFLTLRKNTFNFAVTFQDLWAAFFNHSSTTRRIWCSIQWNRSCWRMLMQNWKPKSIQMWRNWWATKVCRIPSRRWIWPLLKVAIKFGKWATIHSLWEITTIRWECFRFNYQIRGLVASRPFIASAILLQAWSTTQSLWVRVTRACQIWASFEGDIWFFSFRAARGHTSYHGLNSMGNFGWQRDDN